MVLKISVPDSLTAVLSSESEREISRLIMEKLSPELTRHKYVCTQSEVHSFEKAFEKINKRGKNMSCEKVALKNSEYTTRLYTLYKYDENKCRTISNVRIECKNFDTFEKIVKAVGKILKEEEDS